jgi:hypothetical protein
VGCESEASTKKELVHGNDCTSCHADEASTAKNPPHVDATFNDCESCHGQDKWKPAMFAHTDKFPLTAGHAGVDCASCHTKGYTPGMIPNKCVDCHANDAVNVPNPIHAGLSTDCFACHRTDGFSPAHFVHSWPLLGVHMTTQCVACHMGKPALYEGTSTECVSCHQADRARADAAISGHAMYENECQHCHGNDKF